MHVHITASNNTYHTHIYIYIYRYVLMELTESGTRNHSQPSRSDYCIMKAFPAPTIDQLQPLDYEFINGFDCYTYN